MPHDGNHPEHLSRPHPGSDSSAPKADGRAKRWQPTWSVDLPAVPANPDAAPMSGAEAHPNPLPQSSGPAVSEPGAPPVAPSPPPVDAPRSTVPGLTPGFGYDDEHPHVSVPFTLRIGTHTLQGQRLSVTHMHTLDDVSTGMLGDGKRHLAALTVPFDGFAVSLQAEVTLVSRGNGSATFQFVDPTGSHLPQLRYILNNIIAGDFVSVDGLVSYSGPTQPAKAKGATKRSVLQRIRSIAVATLSICLLVAAAGVVAKRYTTGTEMHPVFVERAGQQMRATVAGQVVYVDPGAGQGEVLYAINSNAGDTLNFRMPCDCEVEIASGIGEGTTVLPTDKIMTIFNNSEGVRAQTLMSIEGLSRAMSGDLVHMDLSDGRRMAVTVQSNSATTSASMRGDLFVPVELVPIEGALTREDVGKTARVRLSQRLLGVF